MAVPEVAESATTEQLSTAQHKPTLQAWCVNKEGKYVKGQHCLSQLSFNLFCPPSLRSASTMGCGRQQQKLMFFVEKVIDTVVFTSSPKIRGLAKPQGPGCRGGKSAHAYTSLRLKEPLSGRYQTCTAEGTPETDLRCHSGSCGLGAPAEHGPALLAAHAQSLAGHAGGCCRLSVGGAAGRAQAYPGGGPAGARSSRSTRGDGG